MCESSGNDIGGKRWVVEGKRETWMRLRIPCVANLRWPDYLFQFPRFILLGRLTVPGCISTPGCQTARGRSQWWILWGDGRITDNPWFAAETLCAIIVGGAKRQMIVLYLEAIHLPYKPHQHTPHPNIQDRREWHWQFWLSASRTKKPRGEILLINYAQVEWCVYVPLSCLYIKNIRGSRKGWYRLVWLRPYYIPPQEVCAISLWKPSYDQVVICAEFYGGGQTDRLRVWWFRWSC